MKDSGLTDVYNVDNILCTYATDYLYHPMIGWKKAQT